MNKMENYSIGAKRRILTIVCVHTEQKAKQFSTLAYDPQMVSSFKLGRNEIENVRYGRGV